MSYDYIPIRMAHTRISDTTGVGEDVEQVDHSYIASGNVKRYSHPGKQFDSFL